MNRRHFLGSTVPALATFGPGCLADRSADGSVTRSDDETDASGDRDDGSDDSSVDGADRPAFTLYLENLTEDDHCVNLAISRANETVLEGEYAVPAGEGVRFWNVLEGDSAAISAAVDDVGAEEYTWNRRSCPEGTNAQEASVVIEDDGLQVIQNQCDTVDAGSLLREYTSSEAREGCERRA